MFRKNDGLTTMERPSRATKEDEKRRGNTFLAEGLKALFFCKYLKMIKIILTAASNWEVGENRKFRHRITSLVSDSTNSIFIIIWT